MKLTDSQVNGQHELLASMVGSWKGTSKLWFEAGKLEQKIPISGTMRLVQVGMFLLHEYMGSCMGRSQTGMALHGQSCGENKWTTARMDSFHCGTRIMLSQGRTVADLSKLDVIGHYPAPPDPEQGWRTTLEMLVNDQLVITQYNISPQGEESKAVEMGYDRI